MANFPSDSHRFEGLGSLTIQFSFLKDYIYSWLVVWNMTFMTFHILRMSSSQLTFTTSFFQRGRYTTSQIIINHHYPYNSHHH